MREKLVFTDTYVRNLKHTGNSTTPNDKRERGGLGIRVYPTNEKSFFYQYTYEGVKRFMVLGKYPVISIKEARVRHNEAWLEVKRGGDPGKKRDKEIEKSSKIAHPAVHTIAYLAAKFEKDHSRTLKDGGYEQTRYITREVLPVWGDRPIKSITRDDVKALVKGISERGSIRSAAACGGHIRKMFSFAIDDASPSLAEHNPADNITTSSQKRVNKKTSAVSKRFLDESEIVAFWKRTEPDSDLYMSNVMKQALRLLLLTGQRPIEVLGMHSDEVEGHWWTIPGDVTVNGKVTFGRTKTGVEHRVYLTPLALEVIGNKKGLILASSGGKTQGVVMDSNSLSNAVLRNLGLDKSFPDVGNLFGMEKWTPYNLRKTCSTWMSKLGFHNDTINKVLNHSEGGMIGPYNLNEFDDEKEKALTEWSKMVVRTVKEKIIPINRKAA